MKPPLIKIRAKIINHITTVRIIMNHSITMNLPHKSIPNKMIPTHFIHTIQCESKGKILLKSQWGITTSTAPYLSFKYVGAQFGDIIKVSWSDNQQQSNSIETKIE
jgi:sulfur-oxidizing protein SoxZ